MYKKTPVWQRTGPGFGRLVGASGTTSSSSPTSSLNLSWKVLSSMDVSSRSLSDCFTLYHAETDLAYYIFYGCSRAHALSTSVQGPHYLFFMTVLMSHVSRGGKKVQSLPSWQAGADLKFLAYIVYIWRVAVLDNFLCSTSSWISCRY